MTKKLIILVFLGCFFLASDANGQLHSSKNKKNALDQTARLHAQSILIDGHNDIPTLLLDKGYRIEADLSAVCQTDLRRLQAGGITAQFMSVFVHTKEVSTKNAFRRALDLIYTVRKSAEDNPQEVVVGTSSADIYQAKKDRKIAFLLGIEGGHALEGSLVNLHLVQALGVRYITLVHNYSNDVGDAWDDYEINHGLTPFGKDLVREMQRLGVLVDVSHASDKTVSDVLDIAQSPVIASHSGARSITNINRNLPDDLIVRICRTGGIVMVPFGSVFHNQLLAQKLKERDELLEPEYEKIEKQYGADIAGKNAAYIELYKKHPLPEIPVPSIQKVIETINHIVKVGGIDHVGLGSDFDGTEMVSGLEDVSKYPEITRLLVEARYSQSEIQKILGGNFLRVLKTAEKFSSTKTRNKK